MGEPRLPNSSNFRFADCGRPGNGDELRGSKAGNNEGVRVSPWPVWDASGSRGFCVCDDLLGEKAMSEGTTRGGRRVVIAVG